MSPILSDDLPLKLPVPSFAAAAATATAAVTTSTTTSSEVAPPTAAPAPASSLAQLASRNVVQANGSDEQQQQQHTEEKAVVAQARPPKDAVAATSNTAPHASASAATTAAAASLNQPKEQQQQQQQPPPDRKTKSKVKNSIKFSKKKSKKKKSLLLKDSFLVEIPLHKTVDLGELFCQCRTRYLNRIYQHFPQLASSSSFVSLQHGMASKGGSVGDDENHSDNSNEEGGHDNMDVEDEQSSKTNNKKKKIKKKKKKTATASSSPPPPPPLKKNMPQPRDFGNMLEYLEAKYVQGVMVDADDLVVREEKEGDDEDDNTATTDNNNKKRNRQHQGSKGGYLSDEGAGSVYSESSFLDDTDLRRSIAHQVLAHSTATKLELTQDDNEFFVNVGNLEVEESEFTKEHYDPLTDVDHKKTKKIVKKRKKPDGMASATDAASGTASGSTSTTGAASKKTAASADAAEPSSPGKNGKKLLNPKKKAKIEAAGAAPTTTTTTATATTPTATNTTLEKPKKKEKSKTEDSSAASISAPPQPMVPQSSSGTMDAPSLKLLTDQRKELVDYLYTHLVEMIPTQSFPKRKTKERVAVTCPADKKPGDSILFSNPHVPGQRLKVQIPKNTQPGGTFKVTVPVHEEIDESADHNKLSREFHDTLDDYARAYDDWCDAEGAYRKFQNSDSDYTAHFEKRKKFDTLLLEFPQELKTPVDPNYIKKILRRARQNRSKREQTAMRQQEKGFMILGAAVAGGGLSVSQSTSVGGSPSSSPPHPSSASLDELPTTATAPVAAPPAPATLPTLKVPKFKGNKQSLALSISSNHSKASAATSNSKHLLSPPLLGESSDQQPEKTKPVLVPSLFREFETKEFDRTDFE